MKYKRCLVLVLTISLLSLIPFNSVCAYDTSAEHEVNLYYTNAEETAKIQKLIWGEMRTWGITEAGCAGVIGNMLAESSCDYTRTQSNKVWKDCRVYPIQTNNTGLGLTQWTYYTRQKGLFEMADAMGKQWNTLEVQMAYLKNELSSGYDILYTSNSVQECSDYFLEVYEKPKVLNYTKRRDLSNTTYSLFTGTQANALNTTNANNVTVTEDQIKGVSSELELVGMPRAIKSLSADRIEVEFATRDSLTVGEVYSVQLAGENIALHKQALTIDNARTAVVFLGLVMVFYAIFLLLAMVFDKVNSFIDMSMVGIITLGHLKYSEDELTKNQTGYASKSKILTVSIVLIVLGLLLISGGVIPFMMRIIEAITGLFG